MTRFRIATYVIVLRCYFSWSCSKFSLSVDNNIKISLKEYDMTLHDIVHSLLRHKAAQK